MNDLERLLSDSLKATGESYRPSDPVAARQTFLRRRRRRRFAWVSGGAVALAGAAAVAVLVVSVEREPAIERERLPVAAGEAEVLATTIRVGDAPSGVGVGPNSAWVANTGDGTVSRIDLDTQKVTTITVGGDPDDVAVTDGAAWVADSNAGTLTPIYPSDNTVGEPMRLAEPGGHLDLAVGARGVVWVATGDDWLYRVDPGATQPVRHVSFPGRIGDVATGEKAVWVLDSESGSVGSVGSEPGAVPDAFEPVDGATSINGDLAAGSGYIWITAPEEGGILALDPATLKVIARFPLDADYAGIAIGQRSAWAVSALDGAGSLTRIDVARLAPFGDAIPFAGKPFDVAVGEMSVWVTNNLADTVTRLEVEDSALFLPSVPPTSMPTPLSGSPAPLATP